MQRQVLKAAQDEAEKHGALLTVAPGAKHLILTVTIGDQHRRETVSKSPRSGKDNQRNWVRQTVRRLARDIRSAEVCCS